MDDLLLAGYCTDMLNAATSTESLSGHGNDNRLPGFAGGEQGFTRRTATNDEVSSPARGRATAVSCYC